MQARSGQAGLTVVEVVIAVALQAMIFVSILGVVKSSSDSQEVTSLQGRLEGEARHALETMMREVRQAESSTLLLTEENGSTRIDLRTPSGFAGGAVTWSPTVTYRYEPSRIDSNRNGLGDEGMLVRIQNGNSRVLCHDLAFGGFVATQTGRNVSATLRLEASDAQQRRVDHEATTSVTARN